MQQHDQKDSWKQNFNIVFFFMLIHQRCIVIPMRTRWGVQALGTPCFFALLVMVVWTGLSGDVLMWGWVILWIAAFLHRRIQSLWLYRKGVKIHTHYDGWPDTIKIGRTEKVCKLIVEPLYIGLLGAAAYWLYGEMGWSPYG